METTEMRSSKEQRRLQFKPIDTPTKEALDQFLAECNVTNEQFGIGVQLVAGVLFVNANFVRLKSGEKSQVLLDMLEGFARIHRLTVQCVQFVSVAGNPDTRWLETYALYQS